MKIAFISPEVYPFAKTGGLADVSFSLPVALARKGHDVRIIMPRYYAIDKERFQLKLIHPSLQVPYGFEQKMAAIFMSSYVSDVLTYFIEYDNYFGREGLYNDVYRSYNDNADRFAFFSMAVMEALKKIDFRPDVIHCNDWHTGLVPVYMKTLYSNDPFFMNSAAVMTIHNAGFQGIFQKNNFFSSMDTDLFKIDGLKFFNQINYLKGGVLFSDIVTTVSKKYAVEIQTEEFGYKLAGVFRKIKNRLYGIANGVDYEQWDPLKDSFLPENYSRSNLNGKNASKLELQKRVGVSTDSEVPVIGTISRLTYQKGMDVLAEAMELLLQDEQFQFIVIGSGELEIYKRFERIKNMFPDRVGLYLGYNEELAHIAEAGLDIYVMPSRYEPCGLNQMYSLKYGTIPIVRATGGLDDIIEEWNNEKKSGNGFRFNDLNRDELYNTVRKVIKKYKNRDEWKSLQRNAMSFNYTWDDAVLEYERVYDMAVRHHQKDDSHV